jgi:hypothetical protein
MTLLNTKTLSIKNTTLGISCLYAGYRVLYSCSKCRVFIIRLNVILLSVVVLNVVVLFNSVDMILCASNSTFLPYLRKYIPSAKSFKTLPRLECFVTGEPITYANNYE